MCKSLTIRYIATFNNPLELHHLNRPVWLISMDSDQFNAPPTTTAALTAYFRKYGTTSDRTDIKLEHFQDGLEISDWLLNWERQELPRAREALQAGEQPIVGFSFYTWNAAEFLELAKSLKAILPELLVMAGGPHVQQAEDYLGIDPIDLIFLGEAEISFQQVLDGHTSLEEVLRVSQRKN